MNKISVGIALLGILVLSGCQEQVCLECPKEKAMLDANVVSWNININNLNEIFFETYVYNYGYIEAKDVTVECVLYDNNNNLLSKTSENVGNIASISISFKSIITETPIEVKNDTDLETVYWSICYIKSCSNCEILYKRIPELVDLIEG